ncbi:heme-binding protein 2 isoform X2 [Notothenia coriiceps]|nr:PREDICTED: heme-binding protein 2-like isoform X2 [Notothenia coriiceps]
MLWTRLSIQLQKHRTQHSAMMIYISGLVGFLLVLTAEARIGSSSELDFCSETEQCLLFDSICKTDGYEVRDYGNVTWVWTEEKSYFMDFAIYPLFRRLFNYIRDFGIEMTAPVIINIAEDKSSFSIFGMKKNTYTMSFLMPAEHQANPPRPNDRKVKIGHMDAMKVYVRSYKGLMSSFLYKGEADALSSDLDSAGANYEKDHNYAVGYNSPKKMFDSYNEVWYVVNGEPVCSSSEEMG